MFDYLYNALKSAVHFLWDFLTAKSDSMFGGLLGDDLFGILPDSYQYAPSFDAILTYADAINAWVPIDYGLMLFTLYITFLGLILTFKTILKAVPFWN
jgi:hypothetical protein